MSEFYKPDRHEIRKTENENNGQTTYDYPKENIRIVVDNDPPAIRTVDLTKPEVKEAEQIRQAEQTAQVINNTYVYNDNRYQSNVNTSYVNGFNAHENGLRNKYVAMVLCLCLGWMGAHRYYEGKIATGLLYTFTFGLGGLGWIIDFLILLGKSKYYKP